MNVWDTLDQFAAAGEASVSKSSSSSSLKSVPPSPHHPLKSRPPSLLVDLAPPPQLPASAASTSSLSPAPAADIRSRRSAAANASTAPVDPDVTRPSLKRLTDRDMLAAIPARARAHPAPPTKSRSSLDELAREERALTEGEREVVVHQVHRGCPPWPAGGSQSARPD